MLPHQQIVDIHRDGRLKRVSGSRTTGFPGKLSVRRHLARYLR